MRKTEMLWLALAAGLALLYWRKASGSSCSPHAAGKCQAAGYWADVL